MYDAIMICTGLARLTTGALLAKKGENVLLVQQHNFVKKQCYYI